MTFTIIISAIAVILGGICYLLAKANKKNKVLYREEVERNKRLSDEIYRLGEMERVRHEARTETERKISEDSPGCRLRHYRISLDRTELVEFKKPDVND